jgi:hypothetical protein
MTSKDEFKELRAENACLQSSLKKIKDAAKDVFEHVPNGLPVTPLTMAVHNLRTALKEDLFVLPSDFSVKVIIPKPFFQGRCDVSCWLHRFDGDYVSCRAGYSSEVVESRNPIHPGPKCPRFQDGDSNA